MAHDRNRYPLARVSTVYGTRRAVVTAEEFAAATGLHPELLRRYVTLGLLEPDTDPAGGLWFGAGHLMRVARIQRLRTGLGLNYTALAVVLDLLDRIEQLESALGGRHPDVDSVRGR
ncbi:chaperone modulator CbpM [Streptomyces katrae]|uniref:chaperone modulator CbpM n=1 Tax=Streptomyces katrae TaxID=68223 RepID=UPI000ACC97F3|nr:chaperone modulator CbpM [Streptomyces katrae]